MSLFKAREWWSVVSGYEEFHDLGCLALGNVDNSPTKLDKIVVGSFQGLVRIYEPHPPQFSPDHVILEQQLSYPVLQVAIGNFVQGSPHNHLAILHPRELVVCSLTSEQTTDGSLMYQLTPVYNHPLKRTACNMTWGNFGGEKGRDSLCVQSMDGQLSFFTQETQTFTCFLPDFLLPSPLSYIPRTDALVTVNSAHHLQVFRYQTLSVAGIGNVTSREAGKKFSADWIANIGENAVDIAVLSPSVGRAQILVLGERSVFAFKDNGILRFMKKLDFNPSCFHAYSTIPPAEEDDCGVLQWLLATHNAQIMVLRDNTLVWTASLQHTPVQLVTGSFRELDGVIVSLAELGHLTCSYLGTDPTVFAASSRGQRDIDYQEIDRELTDLNKVIRNSQRELSEGHTSSHLIVSALVDSDAVRSVQLDDEVDGAMTNETVPTKKCVEVQLVLNSSSGPALSNVCLSVICALPLTSHPSHFTLPEVSSTHTPDPLVVTVVATPTLLPSSTTLTLTATYTSNEGHPQTMQQEVELPAQLFCEADSPDKTGSHKVTIEASHYVKELSQLFPAALVHPSAPNNAIGLSFLNGTKLTIVASPSSSRYRLQSDSLAALGVGLDILLSMLSKHFAEGDFKASFVPPLPLNEYFEIIERHYKLRANLEHCREWLARHAHQFRAIQKRLLTRFKDKTPVGLAHLDTLLDGTYMQLMALAEKNELFLLELQECSNQLSCATKLIVTLLRLATTMTEDDVTVLTAALSPHVTMAIDQGWEECTEAAVTHLLRTTLSRSSRETAGGGATLEMPADSSKLKKHIALLCDRVIKGGHPAVCNTEATQSLSPPDLQLSEPQAAPPTGGNANSQGSKVSRGKLKSHPSRLPSLPEVREVNTEPGDM